MRLFSALCCSCKWQGWSWISVKKNNKPHIRIAIFILQNPKCKMYYSSCKKLIDVFLVLNFKGFFFSALVKVRKEDFCLVLVLMFKKFIYRQEQQQMDVQIDIDQNLIREREERLRQIEVLSWDFCPKLSYF